MSSEVRQGIERSTALRRMRTLSLVGIRPFSEVETMYWIFPLSSRESTFSSASWIFLTVLAAIPALLRAAAVPSVA